RVAEVDDAAVRPDAVDVGDDEPDVRCFGHVAAHRILIRMTHSDHLRAIIDRATPLLLGMSDDVASAPTAPEKWSRKQIIGHLIDSATNNHQRFVRVEPDGFHYDQDAWVA